ncbi:uncharacterized protein A4U43_C04F20600 [Asparagus officinalis]|uniref:Secreted protein n=1 Tax=Asparagus officinalis TaxID=4686 RepID=A0A5P1F7B7_ASPOF|nr:uncharacterized protein A4U43_C04F20600 [Asparagus officinalis]
MASSLHWPPTLILPLVIGPVQARPRRGRDEASDQAPPSNWPSKGDKNETGVGEANAAAYNDNLARKSR